MSQSNKIGSGMQGSRRFKKKPKKDPNESALNNMAIKKLARKGGVKRIQGEVKVDVKQILYNFLRQLIQKTTCYTESSRRKTVTSMDVVLGLKAMGRTLYTGQQEQLTLFTHPIKQMQERQPQILPIIQQVQNSNSFQQQQQQQEDLEGNNQIEYSGMEENFNQKEEASEQQESMNSQNQSSTSNQIYYNLRDQSSNSNSINSNSNSINSNNPSPSPNQISQKSSDKSRNSNSNQYVTQREFNEFKNQIYTRFDQQQSMFDSRFNEQQSMFDSRFNEQQSYFNTKFNDIQQTQQQQYNNIMKAMQNIQKNPSNNQKQQ